MNIRQKAEDRKKQDARGRSRFIFDLKLLTFSLSTLFLSAFRFLISAFLPLFPSNPHCPPAASRVR
jgi:hypothetical protein